VALYMVTGGAGFIGSALVHELVRRGEQVRVVDNFATGFARNLTEVADQIDLRRLDISSFDAVREAVDGVDYILHEAALNSVPRSIDNPIASNEANVTGTLNLLVAARDAGVKRVIYASSSSAYGDTPTLPKVETMPSNPISPYSISKYVGEMYAGVFHRVYGLETVALRYFNVFGPRQNPHSPYSAVLSLFITAFLNGQRPTIYGDGEQSRDFTYVDNVVEANLLACHAPAAAGRWMNVACHARYSLNSIIAALNKMTGQNIEPLYQPARAGDVKHSLADITLAGELLGYKPVVSFNEGLARTYQWYADNADKLVG
jgi:UDP-N-acetylglucosamine 4-epimerase